MYRVNVNGFKTERIEVDVSVVDFIEALLREKGWNDTCGSYYEYDESSNAIVEMRDISYHGSPQYEKTVIDTNQEEIDLFRRLSELKDYYSCHDNKKMNISK